MSTSTTTAGKATARRVARHLLIAERLLLGLLFVAVGLYGCFTGGAPIGAGGELLAFGGLLMKAGFLFPLLKGAEVLLEQYLHAGADQA